MNAIAWPFLVADAVLAWMLRDAWRNHEIWLGTRMGHRGDHRLAWWMTVGRLAVLLAMALTGTVIAIRA